MSVDEELIARLHGCQVEGPVPVAFRHHDGEAIPCESAVVLVALLVWRLLGVEQRPLRIIEVRVAPRGVVSELKAPEAIERGDGFTCRLQVEGLGLEARGC